MPSATPTVSGDRGISNASHPRVLGLLASAQHHRQGIEAISMRSGHLILAQSYPRCPAKVSRSAKARWRIGKQTPGWTQDSSPRAADATGSGVTRHCRITGTVGVRRGSAAGAHGPLAAGPHLVPGGRHVPQTHRLAALADKPRSTAPAGFLRIRLPRPTVRRRALADLRQASGGPAIGPRTPGRGRLMRPAPSGTGACHLPPPLPGPNLMRTAAPTSVRAAPVPAAPAASGRPTRRPAP
jgi:hypothetical protein